MFNKEITPIQIQDRLKGVKYPATKEDLIKHVKMNNENEDRVMNVLNQIPDKEYQNPAEVSEEVGNI
ncbi:MAG: DUF2795 domain-containing protein [Balneolaceae bacterium]